MSLNWRERIFVSAYLGECRGDAFRAAWRAGYLTSRDRVGQLLARPVIRAAIEAGLDDAAMRAEEVLARIGDQARATLDDFGHIDGGNFRLDLGKAKRRGLLHCIKKIKPVKDGYELDLYSGQEALKLLGQYHNLWRDGLPASAESGRRRALEWPDDQPADRDAATPPGPDGDPQEPG
jgi:hypothetical protein